MFETVIVDSFNERDNIIKLWEQGFEIKTSVWELVFMQRKVEKEKKARSWAVGKQVGTMEVLSNLVNPEHAITSELLNRGVPLTTLTEFSNYWLERWEGKTKYRFEHEKTFDIKLRLQRWINNQKLPSKLNKPTWVAKL